MVCLECSGLHRQMGTHISKVRSLKLDSKCWEGALLAHMCSIGNTAFNAVWEANLPPDTVLPSYCPENSAVREAYIYSKYLHRSYFKNEAGGTRVAAECALFGSGVVFEGAVVKLSGGKMFGGNKWDKRTLKLEAGDLIYLDGGKEKGRFSLAGCTADALEDDEYSGHPNCFAVQTPTTGKAGKDDGRRYVFQCEQGARETAKWVQFIRYAMSDGAAPSAASRAAAEKANAAGTAVPTPPAVFGSTPGVPHCGLGQVVDQLYGNAAQWVETSTIKSGACRQLGLPNDRGIWHERFVVLTPWCLFVYATPGQWDQPSCSIPLQAAELIDNLRLLPVGAASNAHQGPERLAVAYPLGIAVVAFPSAQETADWNAALQAAIKTSQDAMGASSS